MRIGLRNCVPCVLLFCSSLSLAGCGVAAGKQAEQPKAAERPREQAQPDAQLAAARAALLATEYARSEALLRALLDESPTNQSAARLLGELLLETGRLDELDAQGLRPEENARAAWLLARSQQLRGNLDQAEELLAQAPESSSPEDLALLVLAAEIKLERGKRREAEELLLERVIPAYDSLTTLQPQARGRTLTLIGRAAHLLRSPQDANEAYNQAEELGVASAELLLARAQLFAEKYDVAHATAVLSELLLASPQQPDGLALLARVLLEEHLAFDRARELARKALAVDPAHAGARYVLASIALRELDFSEVARQLKTGLARNPRQLDLLSLQAAARLLAEDRPGFDQSIDKILQLSPGYARALSIVADHAEWEHRYEEMERLLRRAVRLDPDDGRARGQLGLTLVRAGTDSAGVVELRRAFEDDPFNVRVKNTLELYEEIIPQRYVSERHGPFVLRVPSEQRELLMRYVPSLLDQAHSEMVERYGYTPQAPLSIEIYENREQFAVRTSGLPATPIQGVCFGRKLATVSPVGNPANLGMTLWHELAHVFHIGLSQSRVPRWLTEGLAEWETEQLGRGWRRELDLPLYQATQEGSLPHLDRMTQAFTHARRMEDVATAYYASGRIAAFLMESRGQKQVAGLLGTFGEGKLPEEALPLALNSPLDELDREFRDYLRHDLERYQGQFVSSMTRLSLEQAQTALKLTEESKVLDVEAQLAWGQALLLAGRSEAAKRELALISARTPQAAYTLARIEVAEGQKSEALKRLERDLFALGVDGIEPRLLAAKVLLGTGDLEGARRQLDKAIGLDPSAEEVWALRASVAHALKDEDGELDAVREWALRAEHEGNVHRRLLTLLLERGLLTEAQAAAKQAIWSDLGSASTHALAAEVFAKSGDFRQADFEWDSALLCPSRPKEREELVATYAASLERRGQLQRARKLRQQLTEGSAP